MQPAVHCNQLSMYAERKRCSNNLLIGFHVQLRDAANSRKSSADREKFSADTQLEDLISQKPDDADASAAAVQDTLADIVQKDVEMRPLQRQVTPFTGYCKMLPTQSRSLFATPDTVVALSGRFTICCYCTTMFLDHEQGSEGVAILRQTPRLIACLYVDITQLVNAVYDCSMYRGLVRLLTVHKVSGVPCISYILWHLRLLLNVLQLQW